jgi:tetratricopeptide (TPR) repeat protein
MCASRSKYEFRYAKFLLLGSLLVHTPASAQSANSEVQSALSPKPETDRPIEGEPRLSPEEVEDRKLRVAYEQIHQLNTCSLENIQRYDSEVIALAEKSVYEVPKNKFLFIANISIAGCYAGQHRYEQAEERFKRIIVYAAVWPGMEADYPYYFRLVGMTQMGQEHWKDAEDSLNRSLATIDPELKKAIASEHEPDGTRHVSNLLGSKAGSLSCLALVYLHEGRTAESLETADLAYEAVTRPHFQASPEATKQVLTTGTSVAQESGDEVAIAKWSRRSKAGTAIGSGPATPD